MLERRLILPYRDDDGIIRGETVQAAKEGDYYRITSIPLHASRIARFDLIAVRDREGVLYFHKVIENSGRNVIQMIVFEEEDMKMAIKGLEGFGCKWQKDDDEQRIAFDVAKHVPYQPIKDWLDQGEREERWGYREACLSHG